MDHRFAERFAAEWIDAWNAHDLDRILSHYDDDFEMASPIIIALADEPTGKLQGKSAVSNYWKKALARFPDLAFELRQVFAGVNSVTICYQGNRDDWPPRCSSLMQTSRWSMRSRTMRYRRKQRHSPELGTTPTPVSPNLAASSHPDRLLSEVTLKALHA